MRFAGLGGLVGILLVAGASCAPTDRREAPPQANEGTARSALTTTDAVNRAEEWVQAMLLYCQSPNHASDTIDPACPAVCNRTNNAAWDPYRSDCSGLISWAWGLPAPGRTTYGFAPFQTDLTHAIPAAQLAAGDAVNNSDHVMLFKAWVTPGSDATFIEEPGCSANPNYAHEFTSHVTLNGDSITVAYNGMTFTAIRNDSLGPACMNQCDRLTRVSIASTPTGLGYWMTDGGGHVYPNGNAGYFGDVGSAQLAEPVVGIAGTPSGKGYWLAAADGGVFSFGDAGFHGSAGGLPLKEPVVGIAATPDGGGYWLVAGDGGVFSYGDAAFHGSAGNINLNKPVVGMASTPSGQGYWLVAADGGIFAFGDAMFHGSTGGMTLNKPIVAMAATNSGNGYWLVASDGGIFAFGDAMFHGSAGATMLSQPVVGMAATPSDGGYWLGAADGGIFSFGDATYLGNALGSQCAGSTPQACTVASSGCFAWQNTAACPAGQSCGHGTCQAVCTNACPAGTTQCNGSSLQICGDYGTAPCDVWSPPMACPAGKTCMNGVCGSAACTDDCEPGQSKCDGGSLVTCTGMKAGGCHAWGMPTPCMAGQTCQPGGCAMGGSSSATTSTGATGSTGASGTAGTGGAASATTATGAGGGSSSGPMSKSGCACSVSGPSSERGWSFVVAAAAAGLLRRRVNNRGSRRRTQGV